MKILKSNQLLAKEKHFNITLWWPLLYVGTYSNMYYTKGFVYLIISFVINMQIMVLSAVCGGEFYQRWEKLQSVRSQEKEMWLIYLAIILQEISTCNSQFKCQKKWLANYILKLFIVFWNNQFCSVQSLSRVWLFATPWIAASQASLSITNSRSLLELMSIESVMPSSRLILCRPLLLLPPIPPSIRVFYSE